MITKETKPGTGSGMVKDYKRPAGGALCLFTEQKALPDRKDLLFLVHN